MARVPKKHQILTHKAPVMQLYPTGNKGWNEGLDDKFDASKGIADGSAKDKAMDKKRGLPSD